MLRVRFEQNISGTTVAVSPKGNLMVRDETGTCQMENAAKKSTDAPTASAGENAMKGDRPSPQQSDVDARHSRISEAAYRLAEARGFESGMELDDWLAAEREVDETDENGLMPGSKTTPAKSPSASTTPGRPKETASRQQMRSDQVGQTGSSELDEAAIRRDANVAVGETPPDAK
jgi:hypothetical protein